MINTNDGYFYAEGARDIINGTHQENDRSPIDSALSNLTSIIAKILPFSFETIIFFMPVFFSSLIVIPIILIGKSLDKLELGFIASLIASIAWSYYNRTMVGYYDTDLLNIVFPTFLLWSLIWAIRTNQDRYLLFTALDIIAYRWWYPQSYALEFAFFAIILVYIIYMYIKKQDFTYNLTLLTFMMFAMLQIDSIYRFTIVLVLFLLVKFKKELISKYIYYIFAISIIAFFVSGGFDPIWGKLKGYVFKDAISTTKDGLSLHFYTVMQTIREASSIPFETFANRISGHTITFILSLIGYLILVFRFPIMLLGLPMLGLGFLALNSGLRFTIYAVPILAFGIGYFIIFISDFIKNNYIRYSIISFLTILVLLPNIQHIINYKVPTVFTKNEVVVLDKLKNIASREDYIVSWWDYGYPIRYYSDVKTLADGGKHSGSVNFPISYALTNPQELAAKILRLNVEYTEKRFNLPKDNTTKWQSSNIAQMTLDYRFDDTNDFLYSLQTDIKLPKKTRDIYLYLPNRMLNIYPTVEVFSKIDLMSGIIKPRSFFYKTRSFKDNGATINLGNNIVLHKKQAKLKVGNQTTSVGNFIVTYYDRLGKLKVKRQKLNPRSNINIIYMKSSDQFLVVDNKIYNSTYFQLFILENYDKNLYEPVILTPLAKVYKLKI